MLMLPYSTELRLNSRPYIIYSIMLLCFIIFYYQQENNKEIESSFDYFCQSVDKKNKKTSELDEYNYKESCAYNLQTLYYYADTEHWLDYDLNKLKSKTAREVLKKYTDQNYEHYEKLRMLDVPKSLDKMLMYYPYSFNPFKMLTSAVSHADWSHIIFNLIFFFAFAPALEILAQNKLKFIAVLVTIEIVGGLLYSFGSIMDGENIPSLGLSGSVMGMIGLSAFMMPWARIKTFFWFLHFARSVAVPAWILACWYIGWDIYDLFTRTENSSVNFIAHVSGGLTGYLMGYLFFKKEKEVAQHELAVEIDYMRSKRESFSNVATMFKGDSAYIDNKQREHEGVKSYAKYTETLYRAVKAGNTGEAVALLVNQYDMYEESPEIYIELFTQIGEWKKKRVYLCAGRLIVDLLVEKKKHSQIPQVLSSCCEADENFALADPLDLIFVVNYLVSVHQYDLSYRVIHNASDKYGEYINLCDCVLLEAQILWEHLDRVADAAALLNTSLKTANVQDAVKLNEFIGLMDH